DGEVVGAVSTGKRIEVFEDFTGRGGREQFGRDKTLLAGKPAKDDAGKQSDCGDAIALIGISDTAMGKGDLLNGPEEPPLYLAVEAFVKQLNMKDLVPGGVELVEVCNSAGGFQITYRE